VGTIFQIRDDVFDYYDSGDIGKPTGNDMLEGKLTLPVIYALRSTADEAMIRLARKVKNRSIEAEEIAQLVAFTKEKGGIEYAFETMERLKTECHGFIDRYVSDAEIRRSLESYIEFIIARNN